MFENVWIRILIGVVVIALGFMVLKFISPSDQEHAIVEYAAPARPKRTMKSILKKSKGTCGNVPSPNMADDFPQYAPSPVDATMVLGGDFSTNRNAESAIMNRTAVDPYTPGQMAVQSENHPLAPPSIPLGYQYEDAFGAEL